LLGSRQISRKNRLVFSCSVNEWLDAALAYLGVQLLNLTLPIVVDSTQLSGFHSDPFDQVIVATARINGCPLLTVDGKIINYPGVETLL
jgi:PIN domain nuclease of toxin-antitoxin system